MHCRKPKIARSIIELMPTYHHSEPFFEGMAVWMRKTPEGVSEVANDINGNLLTFFDVLLSSEGGEPQGQAEKELRDRGA